MAKIDRFEDLDCWKMARQLTKLTYEASETGKLARDFGTKDQIRRAALSSMSNIAEGFARHSEREVVRFLDIAQSSAVEVKSITYVLEDLLYLPQETILTLRNKTEETRRLTLGFMRYLKSKQPN